jgi:hypothetical protein
VGGGCWADQYFCAASTACFAAWSAWLLSCSCCAFWDRVAERSLVDDTAAWPSDDVHDSFRSGTSLSSCAVTTSRFFFAVVTCVIASSMEYGEAV